MKKFILISLIILVTAIFIPDKALAKNQAKIFYNKACGDCKIYVDQELEPALSRLGFTLTRLDYLENPNYRKDFFALNEKLKVPLPLQDNLAVFIDNGLIIEGHVPVDVIKEALRPESRKFYNQLILYQPEMHAGITTYKVQRNNGEITELKIQDSLVQYLKVAKNGKYTLKFGYLTATIVGGLANSVHPCAIAILIFLVAFLYSIRKSRKNIILLGLTYISGLFLTYFLIGIGLLKVIQISTNPFFSAFVAVILLAVLGLINIKDYFFPQLPIHLRIPSFTKGALAYFIEKATIPATFLLGVLVGLCAFPCTGGIYTAIITSLTTTKQIPFFAYLLLYNFLFVLPLIIIVIFSGNQKVFALIEKFEKRNKRRSHLLSGILMIAVSLGIYLWLKLIT